MYPELRAEHLQRLAEAGVNVERAMEPGQLEMRPWQDEYLRGERFDQDAMLTLIEEVLQSGAAAGYRLTRFLAHMEWALLDKPGVDDLVDMRRASTTYFPSTAIRWSVPTICRNSALVWQWTSCRRTRS